MSKVQSLKECKNVDEFNDYIKKLKPKIGRLGGRRFGKHSYSMNQIVATLEKLANTTSATNQAFNKVEKLNDRANKKLSNKSTIVKALTSLRQFFGNINFNKNEIIKNLKAKYKIKIDLNRHATVLPSIDYEPYRDKQSKIDYDQIPLDSLKKQHDQILLEKRKLNPNLPVLLSNERRATMEGLSIAANYLAEKHKLDNLFVCASQKAFQRKLEEIKSSTENVRIALVVPTYSFYSSESKLAELSIHKIAVGIEKKDGKIKICLIDPSPIRASINPDNIDLCKNTFFSEQELIFAYMKEAALPNTTYYCVTPNRESSEEGGCSTFALRDAIAFIKDRRFFERVEKKGKINRQKEKGLLESPFYIKNLPPIFMRTAQSLRLIDRYIETNARENLFNIKKNLGPTKKPLKADVDAHTRKVQIVGDTRGNMARILMKNQNKAIDDKIKKYQMVINYFLKNKTAEELLKLIERRIVR